jgi:predicted nucleic acid-binding protein
MSEAPEMLVVDASVAVKWYLTDSESGVQDAAALLDDHAAGRCALVAPALLVYELLSVFVRRLPGDARADALDAFHDVDVHLVAATRDLTLEAARLVASRQISSFDSAYAGLASVLGCPLVTADRRLVTALGDSVPTRVV